MPVAQMFEERLDAVEYSAVSVNGRADASAHAIWNTSDGAGSGTDPGSDSGVVSSTGTADDACTDAVPVPEPLAGLLPGGLHRGEVAALATRHRDRHPDYLVLALLAEALNAGLWCAVVGVPDLGLPALTGMLGPTPPAAPVPGPTADRAASRKAALDRLLLVPEPGDRWAEALAALADGVDLLVVRPTTPVSTQTADRIDAHLRPNHSPEPPHTHGVTTHGAALLVLGGWPTAHLSLRITRADWTGLDGIGPTTGAGRLTGCRATVVAQGWATAGRPRAARLWLPDTNGSVRALSDDPRTGGSRLPANTN